MVVSEQWKAVCCRREAVLGTELDIVQFWSFDSALYTAVIRDVRTVTESVYCFHYVCLSVCLSASISAVPNGRIYVKFVWEFS